MSKLGSWRFGCVKNDQHLLLEPSIHKQRELSSAPSSFVPQSPLLFFNICFCSSSSLKCSNNIKNQLKNVFLSFYEFVSFSSESIAKGECNAFSYCYFTSILRCKILLCRHVVEKKKFSPFPECGTHHIAGYGTLYSIRNRIQISNIVFCVDMICLYIVFCCTPRYKLPNGILDFQFRLTSEYLWLKNKTRPIPRHIPL